MKKITPIEKIYKELAKRFKDEPNKNMILGSTMGIIEKYKNEIIQDGINKFKESLDKLYDNR